MNTYFLHFSQLYILSPEIKKNKKIKSNFVCNAYNCLHMHSIFINNVHYQKMNGAQ